MIVAITGGTGFIGRRLALRCLAQGDSVRILSRRKPADEQWGSYAVTWYRGGLEDSSCLSLFVDGVDVLYHCAGQITDQHTMRQLHVDGTQRLIDAANGRVGHWVQLSSVGVYGPVSAGVITEESLINPMGEYEVTKAESDALVLAAAEQGKFSCAILRPSNVYGPEMSNQALFGRLIGGCSFLLVKKEPLQYYIHVDNVVEGLIQCGVVAAAKGKIYNLSDHCSMEELVRVISGTLVCREPLFRLSEPLVRQMVKIFERMPGFPLTQTKVDALTKRSVYSIDRIQTDLGYVHVKSIDNGLRQLVAAYKRKQ